MRRLAFAVLLLAPPVAFATAPPFCVLSQWGRECHYRTYSACVSAARQVDGRCVENVGQVDPARPAPSKSVWRNYCLEGGSQSGQCYTLHAICLDDARRTGGRCVEQQ
jgi:hypothetical protein